MITNKLSKKANFYSKKHTCELTEMMLDATNNITINILNFELSYELPTRTHKIIQSLTKYTKMSKNIFM